MDAFLGTPKDKVIRWAKLTTDLLSRSVAEVDSKTVFLEDSGDELRVSYTLKIKDHTVLKEKSISKPSDEPPQIAKPKFELQSRMTPAMTQECYDQKQRAYICPRCKKFNTSSEAGIKKHYNRCGG
jgi:hypothetical protein